MFNSLIVTYARSYNSFLTHVFNSRINLKASQFEQMTTLLKGIKNAYHNKTVLRLIARRKNLNMDFFGVLHYGFLIISLIQK